MAIVILSFCFMSCDFLGLGRCTVTFDANGGKGTTPENISKRKWSWISLPSGEVLSNGEYAFAGWNTKPTGDGSTYEALTNFIVSENITLYAIWKKPLRFIYQTITDSYVVAECTIPSAPSVVIPSIHEGKEVTSIGDFAFYGCEGLKKITIPNSIVSIGKSAFACCWGLTEIALPESVMSIGDSAFVDCCVLTEITIPSNMTSIENHVFSGCSALTEITIPEGVTSIESFAFWDCRGLAKIIIPSCVTNIEEGVFGGCSGFDSIEVSLENPVYYSEGNCLIEKDTKKLISGCKNSVIPKGVKSIGDYAFFRCRGLTEITIQSSVTSIGDSAFDVCSELTSITLPSSVTSIGYYAFSNCGKLTDIYFRGTQQQWNSITKGYGWNYYTGNYTIHCTDGDIAKN